MNYCMRCLARLRTSLRWTVAIALIALPAAAPAHADVRLPAIFSSNMVLQQGTRVPVWGWADVGEEVTVEFRDQKVKVKAANGEWMLHLSDLSAGGPDTFTVSGKNTIALANVLVGEVWVASGQSNMEWPLRRAFQPENDISSSVDPLLRLFTVPKLKSDRPVADVKGTWQESNSETTPGFSAVAYYFGR